MKKVVDKEKVIGIGMPKTATKTLRSCLQDMGYHPHASLNTPLHRRLQAGAIEEVLEYADEHVSFEDWPWFLVYKEMDQRFPGSKFILTTRKDTPTWHRSFVKNALLHISVFEYVRRLLKKQKLIDWYEGHNKEVIEYFKHRPDDLLVLCFEEEGAWEKLGNFLDRPVPSYPVPHTHKTPTSLFSLLWVRLLKDVRWIILQPFRQQQA